MDEKLKYKIRSVVEKLGLAQARVMMGDDLIRQGFIDNPLSFLNQFNNLNLVEADKIIYYVDNDNLPLFYYEKDVQNSKNGYYWVYYYRIWAFFSEVMNYSYIKTQEIMKEWLDTTYNLRGLRPQSWL